MLFDTHAHTYLAYKKSQDSILENFFGSGGKYLNSIACDIETCKRSIDLARNHSGIYATIGVHPCYTHKAKNINVCIENLLEFYKENKTEIIAIGEIGLDYYHIKSQSETLGVSIEAMKDIQKKFFIQQIYLAESLGLPIVIHCRDAAEDVLKVLQETSCKNFVFHCYSEDIEYAKKLLDIAPDCMFGIGGVVTFKNAAKTREVVENIPMKNIIVETDCPYLTPEPLRGKEENEPLYVQFVIDKIAELRNTSSEVVKQEVFDNATRFFSIA